MHAIAKAQVRNAATFACLGWAFGWENAAYTAIGWYGAIALILLIVLVVRGVQTLRSVV